MEIHVSQSPYAVRLRLMWQNMREDVIANFTRLKSNLSAKEFLERMLSMLPEEFQDIYDDTIPEAKEIRKKMGKKVSSIKSYSCAMPMYS